MTIKRWNGSAQVDVAAVKRWNGSSFVDVAAARRWNGGSWVTIVLPGGGGGDLSATASPSDITVFVHEPDYSAPPAATLYTSATVTATGGSGGGPTYQWSLVEGPGNISHPTSAATSFSCTVYSNNPRTSVFRCRVTRGSETVDVFVNVYWEYIRGIIP